MKKIPDFKNKALFDQAFTHRSFLNETKEDLKSNERMEFLGDSILSFVVSDHLYQAYPDFNEGVLTNLRSLVVNTKSLAVSSEKLDLGSHLKLSRGEEESKGRENASLLANSFEAFVGALYLDQGLPVVREFLNKTLIPQIAEYVQKRTFKDPKSLLQEYVQAQKQHSPTYKVLHEEGPPHAKTFTVGVFVKSTMLGEGKGKSKQEAEEEAARVALKSRKHASSTDLVNEAKE